VIESVESLIVEVHDVLDSTQDHLKRRLGQVQSVHGLVILAGRQTAGRGRGDKVWKSPIGGSYQSLAFRLTNTDFVPGLASLAVGICIAEALGKAGLTVKVKWPNDLYLADHKIAGILCEVSRGYILIGVGINQLDSTVLRGAAGNSMELESLNQLVRKSVTQAAREITIAASFSKRFTAIDHLWGCFVVIRAGKREICGIARGIDLAGCLQVEQPDDLATETVCAGSVTEYRPANEPPG
jgi:BirA family biotin operon repressor/biotin-[acetyl-CoA-carboxylase] ligase